MAELINKLGDFEMFVACSPSLKPFLIEDVFKLNPNLRTYMKGFGWELFGNSFIPKDLESEIKKNIAPKIALTKYLITDVECDRDVFKDCWVIAFRLLDVCAAIRAGQKLSKDTLEKAKDYVMETDDAELLFKYKQATLEC